jgi:Holliday junction resolvase
VRLRPRVDANQKSIAAALMKMGASVFSLASQGSGCPDLLCGWRGTTYLVEVKAEKGKFTPDQEDFYDRWRGGPIVCLRSVGEAVDFFGRR